MEFPVSEGFCLSSDSCREEILLQVAHMHMLFAEEKNAPEEKQPVQKPRVSRRKKSTTADVAATIEAVLPAEVQHEVASGSYNQN